METRCHAPALLLRAQVCCREWLPLRSRLLLSCFLLLRAYLYLHSHVVHVLFQRPFSVAACHKPRFFCTTRKTAEQNPSICGHCVSPSFISTLRRGSRAGT